MSQQLTVDCLNHIFECYDDASVTLLQPKKENHAALNSCLLVSRLWCEVSVRILWKTIQNYKTLVACLPNESKDTLQRNGIIISTPASKPLLFNYVAFVRSLSITVICRKVKILQN